MTAFNQEAMDLIIRLVTSHSTLREAIESKDSEEALRSVKEISLLSMRVIGMIPGLDKIGAKHLTTEEASQLKKDLSSLLSQ